MLCWQAAASKQKRIPRIAESLPDGAKTGPPPEYQLIGLPRAVAGALRKLCIRF